MYVPYVLDKTGSTERVFDLWSRLNQDRVIFLGEEINDHVANIVIAQLLFMESQNRAEDIYLYINSPGGSVTSGLAIFDAINYIEPAVNTICIGNAASMAAVLLASGAKGKRFCTPNASIMIHQVRGGTYGQIVDMERSFEQAKKLNKRLIQILADRTGAPHDKVCQDVDRDYWMTAEEALEYGIVDKIFTTRKEESSK